MTRAAQDMLGGSARFLLIELYMRFQQLLEAHVELNKEEARRATQHVLRRARHYAEKNGEPARLRAQVQ